jgi:hypothetical protein
MSNEKTVPSGLSFAPVNPTGLSAEDIGNYQQNLSDATEALAHRYDNPNWFNVAAGFFKPQLGGFAASLGSASQALGENIEQQRANVAPVAQMRAEMGRMGFLQQQKQKANELVSKLKPGEPVPADIKGAVTQLDPGGPAEASVNAINAEYTRLQEQKASQVSTAATQAKAQTELPPSLYQGVNLDLSNPTAKPQDTVSLKNQLIKTASNIPGSDPEKLQTMNIEPLQDYIYANQKDQRDLSFTNRTEAGKAIKDANTQLQGFGELRTAMSAPGVVRTLSSNKGPEITSLITNYFANQSPENATNLYRTLAQATQKNPEDLPAMEILIKELNKNAAQTRSMLQNPSNNATALSNSGLPSIANSLDAMRAMVDSEAHRVSSAAQTALFENQWKGDPNAVAHDPTFGKLQAGLDNQRRSIIESKPSSVVPKFYSLYGNYADLTSPPEKNAVLNAPSPPPKVRGSGPTASDLFSAARRNKP